MLTIENLFDREGNILLTRASIIKLKKSINDRREINWDEKQMSFAYSFNVETASQLVNIMTDQGKFEIWIAKSKKKKNIYIN